MPVNNFKALTQFIYFPFKFKSYEYALYLHQLKRIDKVPNCLIYVFDFSRS